MFIIDVSKEKRKPSTEKVCKTQNRKRQRERKRKRVGKGELREKQESGAEIENIQSGWRSFLGNGTPLTV